jgi:tRNA(Ile)-lysidine synthase
MEGREFEAGAAAGLGDWKEGTLLLAAVSGGADSTAMLAALAGRCRERGLILHCIHVEHGIRPPEESLGDAAAVKALCADLAVPCRVVSLPPGKVTETAKRRGLGIEGAARFYRHRAWNRERRRIGAERVLVAHTKDDLLETLLMGVLRGAGPGGLAAMPRTRGSILRPLLDLGRADTLAYLKERSLPYRIDSTNQDPSFLRNRVRHKLIPCLDEFFPFWRKTLPDLAETQGMTRDFLAEEAGERIPWRRGKTGGWETDRDDFFARREILREEALFSVLDTLAGNRAAKLPARRLRRASLRLFTGEQVSTLDLGALGIRETGQTVRVFRKRPAGDWGFSLLIKEPGFYKLKGLSIRVSGPSVCTEGTAEQGFFAEFPLVLRRNYADDYIERGKSKRRAGDLTPKNEGAGYERRFNGAYTVISAEDPSGIAAFIGLGRKDCSILLTRESAGRFFFNIGGRNA